MEKTPAGLWIGLPVENSIAHITVVIRHVTDPQDRERFIGILREEIKPFLPIVAQMGQEVIMRGYKGDVPTHDIKLLNPEKEHLIGAIYAREYRQVEGHTQFPTLSLHVTVDNETKKGAVDKILKHQDGVFVIREATLKEIGNKEIIDQVYQ